jgi:hypothetical protein
MQFVPSEKAIAIRYPSVANLMVDSADRKLDAYPLCNDFQISKANSILNGFFTRIGTTEVVFEWTTPNISAALNNNEISYIVTPAGGLPIGNTFNIPTGFYTAYDILDYLFAAGGELNAYTATTGVTWSINSAGAGTAIVAVSTIAVGGAAVVLEGPLLTRLFPANELNFNSLDVIVPTAPTTVGIPTIQGAIDLRPVRYIDIVCNQLTNNQSVKDASTAPIVRDVLCRWYFDYDNQAPTDQFGYPILMGYTPFYLRRIFNPPKQIQWQTNIPIGNISFQLYDNTGNQLDVDDTTNYLMTLQVSEM